VAPPTALPEGVVVEADVAHGVGQGGQGARKVVSVQHQRLQLLQPGDLGQGA